MANWDGFDYANIIANRQKDTFIHGYLDISGRVIITKGDVSISSGNLIANQPNQPNQPNTHQQLFIYDQKINNYRTINYDTLFMLSFFATQQLDKEMQNAKQEIKALKDEVTSLLIKLNDIANNCCNIEQEIHP